MVDDMEVGSRVYRLLIRSVDLGSLLGGEGAHRENDDHGRDEFWVSANEVDEDRAEEEGEDGRCCVVPSREEAEVDDGETKYTGA